MSSTMGAIGARDLGTALTASSSSPPRIVNVADGSMVRELSRLEAAVSSLTVSRIAAWMEQLPSPAKGLKKINVDIFARIIGFVGKPITAGVCKSWREMTLESYHEILASYSRDPYSLALLELATRRVIPTASDALTPEGYRGLDDVTCRNIFNTIQLIKDENLIRFFHHMAGWPPLCMIEDIHKEASALRRWLSHNHGNTNVQYLMISDVGAGLEILPPEVSLLVSLEKLVLADNLLTALPSEFSKLVNLKELNLAGNRFTSRPAVLDQLPLLQTVYPWNPPPGEG